MNMGGMMGGAVSTSLTPWIAREHGWTASFLVAAGLCAVGALAWIFVNPERSLVAKSDAAGSSLSDRNLEVWKT
jgi:ACS family glucarate transporter-like MFS transporter